MKLKPKYIFFTIAFILSQFTVGQKLADKLSFSLAPGVVFIPENKSTNSDYIPVNAFVGFRPGLSAAGSLLYHYSERISFGIDGQFFLVQKPMHSLFNSAAGPIVKFNITSEKNQISPFLTGGLKFGYSYFKRSAYTTTVKPPDEETSELIDINQLKFSFAATRFGIPAFAPVAGAGVDLRINSRIKIFLLSNYTLHFVRNNNTLKEAFPENNLNLSYINAAAGLNYRFASRNKKNKKVYARNRDKTMKKIAQASSHSHIAQKPSMKFKTIPSDGLDPSKKYTISGHVYATEGRKTDDVAILILDENEKIVGTVKTDKNGRFSYKGLKPDNYTLALNRNDPMLKADASISAEDPAMKISASDLSKFPYNRLSSAGLPAGIITGEVKLNTDGRPASDETMLLLDSKGNLAGTTKTNKDGRFAFKNLKTDSYLIVPAENPDIQASTLPATADPAMMIDEAAFKKFEYHRLPGGTKPETVITGKVNGDQKTAVDKTILLLDKNGNVVAQVQSNKEGRFAFRGLKADYYQAVVENAGPELSARAGLSVTDPSLMIDKDMFDKTGGTGENKLITGKADLLNAGSHHTNILLLDNQGNVAASAPLNKDGNFVIKNVRSASYQIVVEGAQYEKLIFDVSRDNKANASIGTAAFSHTSNPNTHTNLIVGRIEGSSLTGTNLIILDEKGNVVERTTADNEGYFVFKNIVSGNYQAVVEGKNYDKISLQVADDNYSGKISAEDFSRHSFHKVSTYPTSLTEGTEMVSGKITSAAQGKDFSDQAVLLLDSKGNIVSKTVVGHDGTFTFKGLKAEGYQVIPENPEPGLKTSLSPVVQDPDLMLSVKDVLKYNPVTNSMENLSSGDNLIIAGAIRSNDYSAAENRIVMLLDESGSVVGQAVSDKEGFFKFSGIKAKDYQVVYEDGEKKVNPSIQMYLDNNPAVTEKGGKIAETLLYGLNEYKLTGKDKTELDKFIHFYRDHPNIRMIKLNAYGDATGTDQANMEITRKRAEQVLEYLEHHGIPKEKLQLNPLGKSLKFKNKYNKPDPKLNRKVDIEVIE